MPGGEARTPKMPAQFFPQPHEFTALEAAVNIGLALVLSIASALLYRRLAHGPAFAGSFVVTLIVTPIVVAMVIMAIGGNVATSLGLVGALSIIRFRTVIRDTRDTAYLFLMIGIGLCCGSGAHALALLGTAVVALVLICIHLVAGRSRRSDEFILVFRRQSANGSPRPDAVLDGMVDWHKLHGAADLGNGGGIEYTYRIRLATDVTPEHMLERLKHVEGVCDTSLISPESQAPV
ncbi:MAG: DUF4956 domain-containing protein [Phycisphaerales bacterium]|nr:MAG: DUF4956 domain-containing protein [Phycisphaerales bacterium]